MHVVVRDNHTDILIFECAHNALDILHRNRVNARKGLVEENKLGVDSHRTSNLRTPTLATRELDTFILTHLLQAELLNQFLNPLSLVLLRVARHFEHRTEVVLHRESAKHRRLLCQVAHTHLGAFIDGQFGNLGCCAVLVFEEDATIVGLHQTHYHIKGSGLTRTVGTQQTYNLALLNINRNVVNNRSTLVLLY